MTVKIRRPHLATFAALLLAIMVAALFVAPAGTATSIAQAKPAAATCHGNGSRSCPTTSTTTTTTATSSTTSSTTSPTAGCAVQWTSSDPFGTWQDGSYLVNNNVWNTGAAGPQTISACSWHQWSIDSNQPGTGTDDSVKAYADTQLNGSWPLSTLTSLPSTFEVTVPAGGGTVPTVGKQWNAAYDLWLDNFGTEVMVWNTWTMNWQYWWNTYNGTTITIDGVAYHAYTNGSGIWFIRDQVTDIGSVDIGHILQWAVSVGWLKSTQTLNTVEYGFEVAYTGEPTTFMLNDYTLSAP
jgi:hypothetical protein